jgi:hypothetical protein
MSEKMKQYRITTDNISKDSGDDCVLDPSDPVNEIKRLQYLGGIGYKPYVPEGSNISVTGNEKAELMKKHDIKPGTPEWFQLWFALPKMTDEQFGDKKWLR